MTSRQLIRLKDTTLFETFLKLLAGRVGQLVNHASLAADVGVDAKTVAAGCRSSRRRS